MHTKHNSACSCTCTRTCISTCSSPSYAAELANKPECEIPSEFRKGCKCFKFCQPIHACLLVAPLLHGVTIAHMHRQPTMRRWVVRAQMLQSDSMAGDWRS